MNDLKQMIKSEALNLGFSYVGVARNDSLEEKRTFYTGFVQRKGHADLKYLETNFEKRMHPELVLKEAKSVISLLINYFPPETMPAEDNFIMSKYAYGSDYHAVVPSRVNALVDFMKRSCPGKIRAKGFVDSGAVLEKAWAQKSGVGWQGKNTILINREAGSFFFIGTILTDLELEPDPPENDHCGMCNKCEAACPTGALNTPYQLEISRCISYWTLETSNEIPTDLKRELNGRIYGCDTCQDVCPFNRFARPGQVPEFSPNASLMKMRKNDWRTLTAAGFSRLFDGSSVNRLGYKKLMQNIHWADDTIM